MTLYRFLVGVDVVCAILIVLGLFRWAGDKVRFLVGFFTTVVVLSILWAVAK